MFFKGFYVILLLCYDYGFLQAFYAAHDVSHKQILLF